MIEKTKILIVDDNHAQRSLYRGILQDAGYPVIEAKDGRDGVKKARADMPDLIVADINMSNMDALEMVRTIKNDDDTKYIPVMCISATYKDVATKIKALTELGAEEYFYLPENREEFLAKVVVMLRIRKIYMELLEKNRQLKQFNSAAIDRELKMIELKNKIKELEGKVKEAKDQKK